VLSASGFHHRAVYQNLRRRYRVTGRGYVVGGLGGLGHIVIRHRHQVDQPERRAAFIAGNNVDDVVLPLDELGIALVIQAGDQDG
jgi:hypothetical protein